MELNPESNLTSIEPFKKKAKESIQESDSTESNAYRRNKKQGDPKSPITWGTKSRFNLPDAVIQKLKDEGKVVSFVPYSVANEEDKERFFKAIDDGWQPIDGRDFPELMRNYKLSPFGMKEEDYLIKKGGQVAMWRDKETHDAEQSYYDAEDRRKKYMTDMYRQPDPRMPKPYLDERRAERNRGF